jgi:hypothetical protein
MFSRFTGIIIRRSWSYEKTFFMFWKRELRKGNHHKTLRKRLTLGWTVNDLEVILLVTLLSSVETDLTSVVSVQMHLKDIAEMFLCIRKWLRWGVQAQFLFPKAHRRLTLDLMNQLQEKAMMWANMLRNLGKVMLIWESQICIKCKDLQMIQILQLMKC